MPTEVTHQTTLNVIEVISFGEVSKADMESTQARIVQLWVETGITRVLVDTRKEDGHASTTDVYERASHLPKALKLALVLSESQPTSREVQFFETVALNRGSNIRKFTSRRDALNWLNR